MYSTKVNAGDSATAQQYNKVRKDASGSSTLLVHQASTPNMTVVVEGGAFQWGDTRLSISTQTISGFTVPSTAGQKKITAVVMDSTGAFSLIDGTATAGTPTSPTIPSDKYPVAEIYLRNGATTIIDDDDSTSNYIIDKRHILQRQTTFTLTNFSQVVYDNVADTSTDVANQITNQTDYSASAGTLRGVIRGIANRLKTFADSITSLTASVALKANTSYVDSALTSKEDNGNKSTSVTTDQASNTKYPSVKAVYDWAVGLLSGKANIAGGNTGLTGNQTINVDTAGENGFGLKTVENYVMQMLLRGATSLGYGVWSAGTGAIYSNRRISVITEGGDMIFSTGGAGNSTVKINADQSVDFAGDIGLFVDSRKILFSSDKWLREDSTDGEIVEIRQNAAQSKPGFKITDQTGDTKLEYLMNQGRINLSTMGIITVSGNPEGSVTANPGSIALSDNGRHYLKISGTGTTGRIPASLESKNITIESPVNGDNLSMFYVAKTVTVFDIQTVAAGTSPSVAWTLKYGSNRTSGTTITTGTTTSTTGQLHSNSTAIPAGSWVWVEIGTVTGTVGNVALDINYY